jgi:ribosomal protein L9
LVSVQNRLENYNTLKFSKKTGEGTVVYFSTKDKKIRKTLDRKDYYFDKNKKQFIINPAKLKGLENKILF